MSNPRRAALQSLAETEKLVDGIHVELTLRMVEDIKAAMQAITRTLRREFEYTDAAALEM